MTQITSVYRFEVEIPCEGCVGVVKGLIESCENIPGEKQCEVIFTCEPKQVRVVVDGEYSTKTRNLLLDTLNSAHFPSKEIVEINYSHLQEISEVEALRLNSPNEIIENNNSKNYDLKIHLLKGLIGTIGGFAVLGICVCGMGMPVLAMTVIGVSSVALTLYLGKESYENAWKKIKNGIMEMDTLFAISSLVAIGASIASFFVPWLPMMFEAGLLIFGFFHIGAAIKESLKRNITRTVRFSDRAPKAIKIGEKYYLVSSLQSGEVINIPAGQYIPVDGICEEDGDIIKVFDGKTDVIKITKGQEILAGMKVPDDLKSGFITMRVTRKASESNLARLDKLIDEANAKKSSIVETANKILQYFVPGVIILAAISGVVLSFLINPALGILCAVSMLVSACPCMLGSIIPIGMAAGIHKAAENGVIFVDREGLQKAATINTVVLDLNGTLTTGVKSVSSHTILNGMSEIEFFQILHALEKNSKNQVAKAICQEYSESANNAVAVEILEEQFFGLRGKIKEKVYTIGNEEMMLASGIKLDNIPRPDAEFCAYLALEKEVIGYVVLSDPLRADALSTIEEFERLNMQVHICSGSNAATLERYKFTSNIILKPNMSPAGKQEYIRQIAQQKRKVCMIGDGANDANAFAESHFAIAMPNSDPMTQQQAGAIIQKESLLASVSALAIAKQTMRNIYQNLTISCVYNISVETIMPVLIALGFAFNPGIGVALMIVQTCLILFSVYWCKQQALPHLKRYAALQKESLYVNKKKTQRGYVNLPYVSPFVFPRM